MVYTKHGMDYLLTKVTVSRDRRHTGPTVEEQTVIISGEQRKHTGFYLMKKSTVPSPNQRTGHLKVFGRMKILSMVVTVPDGRITPGIAAGTSGNQKLHGLLRKQSAKRIQRYIPAL